MSGGSGGYDAKKTGSALGTQLQSYVKGKAPAPSAGTTGGIASLMGAANNPDYNAGIQGAIKSYANTAAGNNIGVNAPGYQAVRNGIRSDVMGDVNSSIGASGRYGSNVQVADLTDQLTNKLGGLDMAQYNSGLDRQAQAAGMLPALQTASTQPGLTQLTAGQVQDTANNADFNRFLQLLQANNSSQGTAGMKAETPWWMSALSLAGQFI